MKKITLTLILLFPKALMAAECAEWVEIVLDPGALVLRAENILSIASTPDGASLEYCHPDNPGCLRMELLKGQYERIRDVLLCRENAFRPPAAKL